MVKRVCRHGAAGWGLIASLALVVAVPAQARMLPGQYTIHAKPPSDTSLLFVSSGATANEPLRLTTFIQNPNQRRHMLWRVDETILHFRGRDYTMYNFFNRFWGRCMFAPLALNGRVGVRPCLATTAWLLNNGSGWVRFADSHGQKVGFQLNAPIYGGPRKGQVDCLDVPSSRYVAGNHLQQVRCTGANNQRFVIRFAGQ